MQPGNTLLLRNIPTSPTEFRGIIAPFREDLVVSAEYVFCWYWLADFCAAEDIPFRLGHALYKRAIQGAKAKNDRIDAFMIAGEESINSEARASTARDQRQAPPISCARRGVCNAAR